MGYGLGQRKKGSRGEKEKGHLSFQSLKNQRNRLIRLIGDSDKGCEEPDARKKFSVFSFQKEEAQGKEPTTNFQLVRFCGCWLTVEWYVSKINRKS